MKKVFIPLLGGLGLLCCVSTDAVAQRKEFNQHISKEFTIPKGVEGVLALYNINGPLSVEGYAGDKVMIEVDETLSADDTATLETGKHEFKLAFDQANDSILVYIAAPYDSRPHHNWNRNDDDDRIEYNFQLSFTVKVPYNTNLDISTVNKGDVSVQDVSGALRVRNVNGAITINNAQGVTRAHTINGNLTVNYLKEPPGNSDYYTLNGRLTVTYPKTLSADLQFKSMNGKFFTDFPNVEELPVVVTKNVNHDGGGTTYKLNIDKRVRIGNGGKLLHFETMNGNIYIKSSDKTII
jgi:hypothetical protein